MIFPIVGLLTHSAWIKFFETCFFLSRLVFTYSNASNSHILQYQGPILEECGVHPIKLIVTWHFPDRAIKGKSQRRIER